MHLAKRSYIRGNFLLLPFGGRGMQRRGAWYRDRIDMTLKECFNNGRFAKYFVDHTDLENWIKKQQLQKLFNDKPIEQNNIDIIEINTVSGLRDYIKMAIKLIDIRENTI